MIKIIGKQGLNQETSLVGGPLPLPPLVIERWADFQGSFDRLCLKAGIAAIDTPLASRPGVRQSVMSCSPAIAEMLE